MVTVNSKPLNFNDVHNQSSPTNCKVYCGGIESSNLTPPLIRDHSMNMSGGNIQCAMNGNFNQALQQSPFQSQHDHHSAHHHSQHPHQHQTNASNSPQQFSHSDLSSEISAAISTAEHLNATAAAAAANDTNSPSSNSQSIGL